MMSTELILFVSLTLLLQTGPEEPPVSVPGVSSSVESSALPPEPSQTPDPATPEPIPCPSFHEVKAIEPSDACDNIKLTPYNSKLCPVVRELYCIALKKTDARRGPSFVTRLSAIDTLGKLKNNPESAAVALNDLLHRVRLNVENEDFVSRHERSLFAIHILQSLGNLGSEAECAIPEIVRATSTQIDVVPVANRALEQILNSKTAQQKTIENLNSQIENLQKELQKLTDEVHGIKAIPSSTPTPAKISPAPAPMPD